MNDEFSNKLRSNLLSAVVQLNNRCLYRAAKWAAEAANGLNINDSKRAPITKVETMSDRLILAKSYFDCHEYDRCANILETEASTDSHALFLRLYTMYISGEKKKEEDQEGILSPKDSKIANPAISGIIGELESAKDLDDDPFLLYLYGVALRHQKSTDAAVKRLVRSIELFPYNWSAWKELLDCLPYLQSVVDLCNENKLDETMTRVFLVHARQEFFQHGEESLNAIEELQAVFPGFSFLEIQKALVNYHGLNYEESEQQFDQVLLKDPYRLDDLDIYSNILYVMERAPKLAFLAQLTTKIDKFRPETCCVVANYYSLRGEHEKAIVYYQRALLLDRNCLSAWTLMGHEFVELKNTHAAIESYRRAVDSSKRDFRAWYGLGQAYEVLDMHYYSLYYYQQAAALKPLDVRMWLALGNSYEKLDRLSESIKCFKRALVVTEMDSSILYKIAILYEKLGDTDNAANYMKLCISEEAEDSSDTISHARLWLAKHEYAQGNLSTARAYAERVTYGTAAELEEAKVIVRGVKYKG